MPSIVLSVEDTQVNQKGHPPPLKNAFRIYIIVGKAGRKAKYVTKIYVKKAGSVLRRK